MAEGMKLREDGVDSLIRTALRLDRGAIEIHAILADAGWERSLETVRKRIRAVRAEAQPIVPE